MQLTLNSPPSFAVTCHTPRGSAVVFRHSLDELCNGLCEDHDANLLWFLKSANIGDYFPLRPSLTIARIQ